MPSRGTARTDPTDGPSREPIPLLPILSVNFIGSLGFSIVLPFLVFLVTRWGGNALIYGIVGATYSAFQLLGAPLLGRWSDRRGRKIVLLLTQVGTLVSWLIFLVAFALPTEPAWEVRSGWLGSFQLTLPLLAVFLARAVDGITGGNVSVANAYLADITPERDRSAGFGKMAVASNLGFIFGPALASLLAATALGELLPVAAAAAISALATWIIAFRLPEIQPCILSRDPDQALVRRVFAQENKPCFEMKGSPDLSVRAILTLPGVAPLLAIQFLVMLGFSFFYVSFPVYAVDVLAWTVLDTGIFFSVMGLSMAAVQGPVLGWLAKRVEEGPLVAVGSLVLAGSFLLFTARGYPAIYAGVALLALGNGVLWPSVLSWTSKAAGDRNQGAVQGFAGSVGAVANILGLVLGGVLYAEIQGSIFKLSAAVIALVCVLSLAVLARRQKSLMR